MTRFVALVVSLVVVVSTAHASGGDVGALLDAFSKMPGLEAGFVEDKEMSLLAAPLRSEGRLYFMPKGYLLRRVSSPSVSSVLVTPSTLKINEGDTVQTLDLSERPEAKLLVGSFVSLLAGDRVALEQAYTLDYTKLPAKRWSLVLRPKDDTLKQLVASVRIGGEGLRVSSIIVHDKNGDKTTTTIIDADPNRAFTDSEKTRLFGIKAR